jgi:hypothetical protein
MTASTGRELRAETHGLMVYEEDTVSIVGMNAQGSDLLAPQALEERLTMWVGATGALTERLRNCAVLLNDSFFIPRRTPPRSDLFDAPARSRLIVVSLLPNACRNANGNSPPANGCSTSADMASSISTAFI